MRKDLDNIKKQYDSIQIPPELDLVIEQAVKRGQRVKRSNLFIRPLAAAAALLLFFVLSVNLSPAFARVVGTIPGMESIIDLISFDRGLVEVVDHGYGQVINKSVTDNGMTLTLESAIYDGKQLILALRMVADRELDQAGFWELFLTDASGNKIPAAYGHGSNEDENTNTFRTLVQFHYIEGSFPESLILECNSIEHIYEAENHTQHREIIAGNWSIPFTLDTELAHFEPIITELDKVVTVGNVKFTIESMSVYPTVAELKVTMDPENPVRITSFKNLRVMDEEGNKYSFRSSTGQGNEYVYRFESNYFLSPKQLTLELDGVYTLPWEDTYFILDIENEKVLDDGGLGIEFVRKSVYLDSIYERNEMTVWFEVNDPEFVQADDRFIWVDTVQDLSGNPYHLIHHAWSSGQDQFGLGFNADEEIPNTVKVRVNGISKGIMESVEVPLK